MGVVGRRMGGALMSDWDTLVEREAERLREDCLRKAAQEPSETDALWLALANLSVEVKRLGSMRLAPKGKG